MSALLTTTAYAAALGKSLRTVQRYLERGQLAGAQLVEGQWLIPADAVPTTSSDVVAVSRRATSYDVAPATSSPLGALGTLEDAAALLGTSVGGARRMARRRATRGGPVRGRGVRYALPTCAPRQG